MSITKITKRIKHSDSNPRNNPPIEKKTVSVDTLTRSFDIIRIYLTEDGIEGVSDHLDQIEAINAACEDDVIEVYCMNCPGGSADTIIALLNALACTDAHTVCIIEGHNASAGTMPAMVTNEVHIGKYASFMLHSVSGGVIGSMKNTAEAAKFYERQYAAFIEEVYQGFVSPDELSLIHNGREIYLSAEDIAQRLESRQEFLRAKYEAENAELEPEPVVAPKRSRKKVQE